MKFWSFINLPWGHMRFHTKVVPDRFSCFAVYWIQTDRHPDRQAKYILLSFHGALRSIFWFNCKIFYLCPNKNKKKLCGFYKNKIVVDFQNFCWRQIFEILIILKFSSGSCEVLLKIWARSVSPFKLLLDTNTQTGRLK